MPLGTISLCQKELACFESMRFQELEILDINLLSSSKDRFNKKVSRILEKFIKFIKQRKNEYRTL